MLAKTYPRVNVNFIRVNKLGDPQRRRQRRHQHDYDGLIYPRGFLISKYNIKIMDRKSDFIATKTIEFNKYMIPQEKYD